MLARHFFRDGLQGSTEPTTAGPEIAISLRLFSTRLFHSRCLLINGMGKNPVLVPREIEKFRPLQLVVFSSVQSLDATFTESDIPNQVGKTPAFAPDFLWKGGISFRQEQRFNVMLSAIYISEQFWSDANVAAAPFPGAPPTPAKPPRLLRPGSFRRILHHEKLTRVRRHLEPH